MGNTNKQYPGYFRGKRVRIEKVNGSIVVGILQDITEYKDTYFLVVEIGTGQEVCIQLPHVIQIEEGAN